MLDVRAADLTQGPAASRPQEGEPLIDVSVLVPVLDEGRHLTATVAEMLAQDFQGTVEFLYLDGGSHDGSREILESLAAADRRVRVLDNPARRTPQALNLGLKQAHGTYIARMDAHTHYPRGYLRHGVERLRRGDVVSVSGPQLAVGRGRWSRRVALALSTPLGVGGARFREATPVETEVESGFTGVWRREVLLAAGGWDEAWLNDQDTELAARLRKDGGRIVCVPEMAASYVPRDSLRALFAQYDRYGWYRVKTSHRHPETLRLSQLLPPVATVVIAVAAAGSGTPRLAARWLAAAYAAALSTSAMAAVRRGAAPADAAAQPLVHATMHVAYGVGFLRACVTLGPPAEALRCALARSLTRLRALRSISLDEPGSAYTQGAARAASAPGAEGPG